MKESIKSLPKCTQNEINVLCELILKYLPNCSKIILFGSYAKKKYVLYDESIENGVTKYYQSDLDILVIMKSPNKVTSRKLRSCIIPKYNQIMESMACRHAPARIIIESTKHVNQCLEVRQFFFTEIINDGILLYDKGDSELAKSRVLTPKEIFDISESYYNNTFPYAKGFLFHAGISFERKEYNLGLFLLHQACENLYNTIELVHTHYQPKNHKLAELAPSLYRYSNELSDVFPINEPFKMHCFNQLCDAYIKARYDITFIVTKEEMEYLISRVELLKEITYEICIKHLNYLKELK